MLVDARAIPARTVIESEVCIVGGGAAGITLAREFLASGFRVALLESGGTDMDAATQDLYSGSDVGRSYQDLTAIRLRYFGGTTNHWEGWCAVPDPIDFESREGVAYSGWPFAMSHLLPFYRRAQPVCQLGPYGYAPSDWGIAPAAIPQPFDGPHFVCQVLQKSPPTRFAEVYGPSLRQAPRLTVYLNANALQFETSRHGGDVEQLKVGVLGHGGFTLKARLYVLATGAVENARLLLSSGQGLGNDNDLVGRFFAVHMEYIGGLIAPADPYTDFQLLNGDATDTHMREGVRREFISYVALSEATRRRQKLPGMRIRLHQIVTETPGIDALKRLAGRKDQGEVMQDMGVVLRDLGGVAAFAGRRMLHGKGVAVEAIAARCTSEQTPNPDSRILLGTERDALGLRRVKVDWRLTARDKQGAVAANRLLGTEIGRSGLGRMRTLVSGDDTTWPADLQGDEHTMGTTRMHRDPKSGVVDENCKVHGLSNLYVAGSSVFPTTGTANPTLTIVALAIRLADHLKGRLA